MQSFLFYSEKFTDDEKAKKSERERKRNEKVEDKILINVEVISRCILYNNMMIHLTSICNKIPMTHNVYLTF